MQTISISKVSTFSSCAWKYNLQYKQGLHLKRGDVSPRAIGDVIHFGIAAGLRDYYHTRFLDDRETRNKSAYGAIAHAVSQWGEQNHPSTQVAITFEGQEFNNVAETESQWQEFNSMLDTAEAVVFNLFDHLDIPNNYEIVDYECEPLVEFWVSEPLPQPRGYQFNGIIDAVLINKNTGLVEVIDWKTRKNFIREEQQDLDMQVGLYQHVLRNMGIDAEVGIIYQIKPEVAKVPDVNKDGSMSRRKINTTWDIYKTALIVSDLDPDDYSEMQEKLSDIEFFRPLRFVRGRYVTEGFWQNLVDHAKAIKAADAAELYPRAFGYNCRFCQFHQLCYGGLHGYDVSAIIKDRYEIDNHYEGEEDE